MAINVAAEPFEVTTAIRQVALVGWFPVIRDPDLDQTFSFGYTNDISTAVTLSITGTWLSTSIFADPFVVTTSISSDEDIEGLFIDADPFLVTINLGQLESGTPVSFTSGPVMVTAIEKKNFVAWSDIGSATFTIDRSNVAGERPMPWKGWVYDVRTIENTSVIAPLAADRIKVIVYGEGGVALLTPHEVAFGMKIIYPIGLKGWKAVAGTPHVHWFVDQMGQLFQIDEKLTLLGYSEFLDSMNDNLVLSYDPTTLLLYICDGDIGYVYSVTDQSLGRGPANITGIGVQGGTRYVCASATIAVPPFEFCSDIYDMNTRRFKTIFNVEFSVNNSNDLWAAIDWRMKKDTAFATTPWVKVNPDGRAYVPCTGVEFKFRLKNLTYEDFKVDSYAVNGVVHNHSYLDVFAMR